MPHTDPDSEDDEDIELPSNDSEIYARVQDDNTDVVDLSVTTRSVGSTPNLIDMSPVNVSLSDLTDVSNNWFACISSGGICIVIPESEYEILNSPGERHIPVTENTVLFGTSTYSSLYVGRIEPIDIEDVPIDDIESTVNGTGYRVPRTLSHENNVLGVDVPEYHFNSGGYVRLRDRQYADNGPDDTDGAPVIVPTGQLQLPSEYPGVGYNGFPVDLTDDAVADGWDLQPVLEENEMGDATGFSDMVYQATSVEAMRGREVAEHDELE